MVDSINICNANDQATCDLLGAVERECGELGKDFDSIPNSRSVNFILIDVETNHSKHAAEEDARGSAHHLIGTSEQLAGELFAALDEQIKRLIS